jgi:hypothetical protein
MLQNKGITKIQEIKTLFNESWIQPEFFSFYLKLFKFSKTTELLCSAKKNGYNILNIIQVLLILPFKNHKTIHSYTSSKNKNSSDGAKDIYYRTLKNQNIKWRSLLFLFVKKYLKFDKKLSSNPNDVKCLIFDDTDIEKRGKKIEGVSKIYNHVSHSFILGYKLLVAGYWNGSVLIPVDFSFHRENKDKKKKYGLDKKQLKNQKSVSRKNNLPVYKRFKELNVKKTDMIVQMFKRVKQRRIHVDYILIDSWFTSMKVVKELISVNSNVNIIGMYKYNSTVIVNGKNRTIKQLRQQKKKLKRSRKMNFYYLKYKVEIDGVKLNMFLTRRGTNGAWHTIVSTDTSLTFIRTMEIYGIRWSIEVFFKESKQLLGLGTCQSTNFDVQVAQTSITMIQYLLISLKFRLEAYETIGGLFKDIKQDYIEHKLNERIIAVMIEIIACLELIIGNIDLEQTIKNLILNTDSLKFLNKWDNNRTTIISAA